MEQMNKILRIYSGNEVNVNLLKGRLEIEGIPSTIRNDSGDSFLRGVPVAIDLYIQESDFKNAKSIVEEFIKINH